MFLIQFRTVQNFNHTLSAILRGKWMLDPQWAAAHLPLVLNMLDGKPVSFVDRSGGEEFEMPFGINPNTMERVSLYVGGMPSPNVPPGTVGVLPINGPITKYDGSCGEPGMITRNNWLNDLMRRDNISSIIQLIDTPGGEVRANTTYLPTLQKRNKPVLAFIDNMCASMGMWFSSASDEVYTADALADIGSIGAYCTIADFSGYYEKMGVKLHSIYAPQSTEKNKPYNDVISGLPEGEAAYKEDLKMHVDAFINFVGKQRGDKAVANADMWNKGKLGNANWAMKAGLIDGVMDFEKVVSKAAWLGKRNKI
jgi:ClpP class serine protease